jgi:hypothetical protein
MNEAKHIALMLMTIHRKCKLDDLASFPETENDHFIEKAVFQVLELLHEGYEVPFIETYRPDEYQPYLTRRDLWRIYDLDGKFEAMQVSKSLYIYTHTYILIRRKKKVWSCSYPIHTHE